MMFDRHIESSLTRYCDGDLSAAERQRVDAHLATCARCRAALEEIQFSVRLVKQLSTVSAPPAVWTGIESALAEPHGSFQGRQAMRWAFACMLVLAVGAGGYWWTRESVTQPWEVAHTSGEARRMAAGEWVETSPVSKARIIVGTLGTVDVEPGTRVQLGKVQQAEYRLALAHGTISAQINAPPRLFIVDTPASTVVDLGCAYTVTVGEQGVGELRMTSGWAALEFKGRESLVPAGAIAQISPFIGPGTPYFEDASDSFKRAVRLFDNGDFREAAFETINREARVRDTLTLWHLLSRTEGAERVRVYDRIAGVAPPPSGVSRDQILALDADALRKWREELAWKW
jgi:predicted anti-sigma-YlaC factor YlaD